MNEGVHCQCYITMYYILEYYCDVITILAYIIIYIRNIHVVAGGVETT